MPFSVYVLQHDEDATEVARAVDLAFCDVLLLVAHCDGELSQREALFASVFSTLTLTPDYYAIHAAGFARDVEQEGLDAVKARVLAAMSDVLERLPGEASELRQTLSTKLLESICSMAAADRVLHPAERALVVQDIAPLLGLAGDEAERRLHQQTEAAYDGKACAKLLTELYVWVMDRDPGARVSVDSTEELPKTAVLEALCHAYSGGPRAIGDLSSAIEQVLTWARSDVGAPRDAVKARLSAQYQVMNPADQREVLGQWFFFMTLQDGLSALRREALGEAFEVLGQEPESVRKLAQSTLFDNPFFFNSMIGLGDRWGGVITDA